MGPQLRAHHAAAHAGAGRGRRGAADQVGHAHLGPRRSRRRSGRPRTGPSCGASITGPTRASRAGTTSPWPSRRRRWRWGCFDAAGADPAAPHRRVSHRGAAAALQRARQRPRRGRRWACRARHWRVHLRHMLRGAGACVACWSPEAPASSAPTSSSYWLTRHPGDRVVVLDALTYAGNLGEPRAGDGRHPGFTFVHGDIRTPGLAEQLLREHEITTVVHFAAESHVDRSIAGPDAFVETNVVGTHALLKAARAVWLDGRLGRREASSTTSPPTRCTARSGPTIRRSRETTPYAPNSPYAASKAASDHLVRAYHHTYGLPVTTSNCSNNYGPYQFPEKLIPLMLVNALEGKPLPVYGDGAECARLAVRGGPLPGARAGRAAGTGRGDLQRRRPERVDEPRHRPPALPAWSTRPSPPTPSCARGFPSSPAAARREVSRAS